MIHCAPKACYGEHENRICTLVLIVHQAFDIFGREWGNIPDSIMCVKFGSEVQISTSTSNDSRIT